jgi:isopentenyldiphosphate isomerase
LNNHSEIKTEYIEEWDWERAVSTGKSVERRFAHRNGIAHEGVHLWIVRTSGQEAEILFQHRAEDKEMYPGCFDITVGGHVPFGRHEKKIQKESSEELGISPEDDELINLGYYRYEEKLENFFHREFQAAFIMEDNRSLDQYVFADGEVDGLCAVKLTDLMRLMKEDFSFEIEIFENNILHNKYVTRMDFHPLLFSNSMKKYMEVVIQASLEIAASSAVTARMPAV